MSRVFFKPGNSSTLHARRVPLKGRALANRPWRRDDSGFSGKSTRGGEQILRQFGPLWAGPAKKTVRAVTITHPEHEPFRTMLTHGICNQADLHNALALLELLPTGSLLVAGYRHAQFPITLRNDDHAFAVRSADGFLNRATTYAARIELDRAADFVSSLSHELGHALALDALPDAIRDYARYLPINEPDLSEAERLARAVDNYYMEEAVAGTMEVLIFQELRAIGIEVAVAAHVLEMEAAFAHDGFAGVVASEQQIGDNHRVNYSMRGVVEIATLLRDHPELASQSGAHVALAPDGSWRLQGVTPKTLHALTGELLPTVIDRVLGTTHAKLPIPSQLPDAPPPAATDAAAITNETAQTTHRLLILAAGAEYLDAFANFEPLQRRRTVQSGLAASLYEQYLDRSPEEALDGLLRCAAQYRGARRLRYVRAAGEHANWLWAQRAGKKIGGNLRFALSYAEGLWQCGAPRDAENVWTLIFRHASSGARREVIRALESHGLDDLAKKFQTQLDRMAAKITLQDDSLPSSVRQEILERAREGIKTITPVQLTGDVVIAEETIAEFICGENGQLLVRPVDGVTQSIAADYYLLSDCLLGLHYDLFWKIFHMIQRREGPGGLEGLAALMKVKDAISDHPQIAPRCGEILTLYLERVAPVPHLYTVLQEYIEGVVLSLWWASGAPQFVAQANTRIAAWIATQGRIPRSLCTVRDLPHVRDSIGADALYAALAAENLAAIASHTVLHWLLQQPQLPSAFFAALIRAVGQRIMGIIQHGGPKDFASRTNINDLFDCFCGIAPIADLEDVARATNIAPPALATLAIEYEKRGDATRAQSLWQRIVATLRAYVEDRRGTVECHEVHAMLGVLNKYPGVDHTRLAEYFDWARRVGELQSGRSTTWLGHVTQSPLALPTQDHLLTNFVEHSLPRFVMIASTGIDHAGFLGDVITLLNQIILKTSKYPRAEHVYLRQLAHIAEHLQYDYSAEGNAWRVREMTKVMAILGETHPELLDATLLPALTAMAADTRTQRAVRMLFVDDLPADAVNTALPTLDDMERGAYDATHVQHQLAEMLERADPAEWNESVGAVAAHFLSDEITRAMRQGAVAADFFTTHPLANQLLTHARALWSADATTDAISEITADILLSTPAQHVAQTKLPLYWGILASPAASLPLRRRALAGLVMAEVCSPLVEQLCQAARDAGDAAQETQYHRTLERARWKSGDLVPDFFLAHCLKADDPDAVLARLQRFNLATTKAGTAEWRADIANPTDLLLMLAWRVSGEDRVDAKTVLTGETRPAAMRRQHLAVETLFATLEQRLKLRSWTKDGDYYPDPIDTASGDLAYILRNTNIAGQSWTPSERAQIQIHIQRARDQFYEQSLAVEYALLKFPEIFHDLSPVLRFLLSQDFLLLPAAEQIELQKKINDLATETSAARALVKYLAMRGYVKFAQFAATQIDIDDHALRDELETMKDQAPPSPPGEFEALLRELLQSNPHETFRELGIDPIASASMADVHTATLADGTRVAIKGITRFKQEAARAQLDSLLKVAHALTKRATQFPLAIDPTQVVQAFRAQVLLELDLTHEPTNAARLAAVLPTNMGVPRYHAALSGARVLTMDFVSDPPLGLVRAQARLQADIIPRITRMLTDQIFQHGVVYTDPHDRNIFVAAQGFVTLLDHGQQTLLDDTARERLRRLFMSVLESPAAVAAALVSLETQRAGAQPHTTTVHEQLTVDVASILPDNKFTIDAAVMQRLLFAAKRRGIAIDAAYINIIKTLLIWTGEAKKLDPTFSLAPYVLQSIAAATC